MVRNIISVIGKSMNKGIDFLKPSQEWVEISQNSFKTLTLSERFY